MYGPMREYLRDATKYDELKDAVQRSSIMKAMSRWGKQSDSAEALSNVHSIFQLARSINKGPMKQSILNVKIKHSTSYLRTKHLFNESLQLISYFLYTETTIRLLDLKLNLYINLLMPICGFQRNITTIYTYMFRL